MAHRLTPSDLENNNHFELIKVVPYTEIKAFVFYEIKRKSTLLRMYGIVQLLAGMAILGTLSYFAMKSILNKTVMQELYVLLYAFLSSFTIIIPIHEGIHAIAFLLLGKKNISFGAQWSKFMFYAESDRQVLSRKEMLLVALLPLMVISFVCLIILLISDIQNLRIFFGIILLIHLFFCSGDLAIVSFFQRHLPEEVFTYDSRSDKKTFYYKRSTLN